MLCITFHISLAEDRPGDALVVSELDDRFFVIGFLSFELVARNEYYGKCLAVLVLQFY